VRRGDAADLRRAAAVAARRARRDGFHLRTPHGALYVWANTASTGIEAAELSYLFLQEANVLIFPGTGFGDNWGSYMRMTLLQPEEVLAQAVERMKAALAARRAAS
jgi:aspartate/methionine/tyrosine aminotransferase